MPPSEWPPELQITESQSQWLANRDTTPEPRIDPPIQILPTPANLVRQHERLPSLITVQVNLDGPPWRLSGLDGTTTDPIEDFVTQNLLDHTQALQHAAQRSWTTEFFDWCRVNHRRPARGSDVVQLVDEFLQSRGAQTGELLLPLHPSSPDWRWRENCNYLCVNCISAVDDQLPATSHTKTMDGFEHWHEDEDNLSQDYLNIARWKDNKPKNWHLAVPIPGRSCGVASHMGRDTVPLAPTTMGQDCRYRDTIYLESFWLLDLCQQLKAAHLKMGAIAAITNSRIQSKEKRAKWCTTPSR